MGIETEHKFLVDLEAAALDLQERVIRVEDLEQAYVVGDKNFEFRIRLSRTILPLSEAGTVTAMVAAKGARDGASRPEIESAIDSAAAIAMLAMHPFPRVHKIRHTIPAAGGLKWEVDIYERDGRQLATAEIEIPHKGYPFDKPSWIGREVTGEAAYANQNLAHSFPAE
jgi:CYTH domain-containing protein